MIFFETSYSNSKYLAAVDEVGRGPLAGPVVAAAVVIESKNLELFLNKLQDLHVTDSKKLTSKKRRSILKELNIEISKVMDRLPLFSFAISEVGEKMIDEINILQSGLLAMKNAFKKIADEIDTVLLIDGNIPIPDLKCGIPIVKGDSRSMLIGLASIIAKEYRDNLMIKLSEEYPHYKFADNFGYPTAAHLDAIIKYGVTNVHRKSFRRVREFV